MRRFIPPHRLSSCLLLLALATVPACGSDGSADDEGATESETGMVIDGPLLPLVDGADWTYVEYDGAGAVTDSDYVSIELTQFEGADAFLMLVGSKQDMLVDKGGAVSRVQRERVSDNVVSERITYDPGFLRVDEGWKEASVGEVFMQDFHRVESDGEGMNAVEDDRTYTYTIIAMDEEVEVQAGIYTTIHVERECTAGETSGDIVEYWFAAGVGKVQEHQHEHPDAELEIDEKWEKLLSFSIPGGASA